MSEHNEKSDIIVIGAGIIGVSLALRLAQEHLQVTVLDRESRPGKEASSAAAGMLAVQAEAIHGVPGFLSALFQGSLALYPDFINELQQATGIHIGFVNSGSLVVAADYKEAKLFAGLMEQQIAAGNPVEELSASELRKIAPDLSDGLETALLFPNDCYVDNRQLMKALVTAAANAGVKFYNDTVVTGFKSKASAGSLVETTSGNFAADDIVISAGSWSGLLADQFETGLPVRPIRGQILRLQKLPQKLRHLVFTPNCYLVPWPDGRVLVGATMENVGYNKEVTAAGVEHLLSAALSVAPGLSEASFTHFWAGLRPDTTDGLPIIGRVADTRVLVATGHFRNGILLAPITAKAISDIILTGNTSVPIDPFSPNRFQH